MGSKSGSLEQEYGPPKVQTLDPREGRRRLPKRMPASQGKKHRSRLKILGATQASARAKL